MEREHYSRSRKPDRYLPWTSVSSSVKMRVVSEMTSEVSEVPSCCLTRLVKCQPMVPENSGGRAKPWGGERGNVKKPSRRKRLKSGFKDSGPCPVDNKYTRFGKLKCSYKEEIERSQNTRSLKCHIILSGKLTSLRTRPLPFKLIIELKP